MRLLDLALWWCTQDVVEWLLKGRASGEISFRFLACQPLTATACLIRTYWSCLPAWPYIMHHRLSRAVAQLSLSFSRWFLTFPHLIVASSERTNWLSFGCHLSETLASSSYDEYASPFIIATTCKFLHNLCRHINLIRHLKTVVASAKQLSMFGCVLNVWR